jgi:hypothetical protein
MFGALSCLEKKRGRGAHTLAHKCKHRQSLHLCASWVQSHAEGERLERTNSPHPLWGKRERRGVRMGEGARIRARGLTGLGAYPKRGRLEGRGTSIEGLQNGQPPN